MFKIHAPDACVMSNPKDINMGNVIACSFFVGTCEHPTRTFTEMAWVRTVVHVLAFGKCAKFAIENLQKGALIYIEGVLVQRQWTSPEGIVHALSGIRAQIIQMTRPSNSADLIVINDEVQRIMHAWANLGEPKA